MKWISGPILIVLLLISGVTACAPVSRLPQVDEKAAEQEEQRQRELVVRQKVDYIRRLDRVAFPILLRGADICAAEEQTTRDFGLKVVNKYYFARDDRKAAERALGFGDAMKVLTVAPGSPAEIAGIQVGDTVTKVNGWVIPLGSDGPEQLTDKYENEFKEREDLDLTVMREGKEKTITLTGVDICDYPYAVENNPKVNAYADGERIIFNTGMMDFIRTDEELATVVGHEIAHNLMDHISKKQGNALMGTVVDILFAGFGVNTGGALGNMAGQAYSQDFEAEADYVGLYLTARGGFDISKSPSFWRRMGVKHPGNIEANHAASHPATPHRFIALEQTVAEIENKRSAGQPLIPERAREHAPKPEASTETQ